MFLIAFLFNFLGITQPLIPTFNASASVSLSQYRESNID